MPWAAIVYVLLVLTNADSYYTVIPSLPFHSCWKLLEAPTLLFHLLCRYSAAQWKPMPDSTASTQYTVYYVWAPFRLTAERAPKRHSLVVASRFQGRLDMAGEKKISTLKFFWIDTLTPTAWLIRHRVLFYSSSLCASAAYIHVYIAFIHMLCSCACNCSIYVMENVQVFIGPRCILH